ncbi:MAG: hypothetical protein IKO41_16435 [Lachnospiraceae bacterium]|nr:hypothetical protein [Lachnospiraceae bacterium]
MHGTKNSIDRILSLALALVLCIMLVPGKTLAYLNAEDLEEIQEKWHELRDYPMKPGDEGWDRMDYGEILKVVNPPQELIDSMSTRELADLMLHYPLLNEMDTEETLRIMSGKSQIFLELRWRKDGTKELLNALRDIEIDMDVVKAYDSLNMAFFLDPSLQAEKFVNVYVRVYGSEFTEEEISLYDEIWNERNEKYYKQFPEENYCVMHIELKTSQTEKELPSADELWKRWYDRREYPIMPGDENWERFDVDRQLRILNPPDEVLKEMSSKELASLAVLYPFLWQYEQDNRPGLNMDSYDVARQFFTINVERHCKIFKELIGRKDGAESLLRVYEANELNVDEINQNGPGTKDPSVVAELFLCKYVEYYNSWRFQESDIALYKKIYRNKVATYEKIENETVREAFSTKLSKAALEETEAVMPSEEEMQGNAEKVDRTGKSVLDETLAGMESESNGDLVEETEEANSGKNIWMIAAIIMVVLLLSVACCLVLRNGKRKE